MNIYFWFLWVFAPVTKIATTSFFLVKGIIINGTLFVSEMYFIKHIRHQKKNPFMWYCYMCYSTLFEIPAADCKYYGKEESQFPHFQSRQYR